MFQSFQQNWPTLQFTPFWSQDRGRQAFIPAALNPQYNPPPFPQQPHTLRGRRRFTIGSNQFFSPIASIINLGITRRRSLSQDDASSHYGRNSHQCPNNHSNHTNYSPFNYNSRRRSWGRCNSFGGRFIPNQDDFIIVPSAHLRLEVIVESSRGRSRFGRSSSHNRVSEKRFPVVIPANATISDIYDNLHHDGSKRFDVLVRTRGGQVVELGEMRDVVELDREAECLILEEV